MDQTTLFNNFIFFWPFWNKFWITWLFYKAIKLTLSKTVNFLYYLYIYKNIL